LPTVNSFDGIKRAATILNGGNRSNAINIPRNVAAMTVWIPSAFDGSIALQLLLPDQPEGTTWVNAYDFVDTTTPVQVAWTPVLSSAVTLKANTFGGGTARFASYSSLPSTDQNQSADRLIYVFFSGFQN
jgi:hypothetical protein